MSYTIFDPQVDGPCHLLSRKEARKSFNWFLSQKDARQHNFWEEMRRKSYEACSHDELCVMFERVLIDVVAELAINWRTIIHCASIWGFVWAKR